MREEVAAAVLITVGEERNWSHTPPFLSLEFQPV